jgi:integrase
MARGSIIPVVNKDGTKRYRTVLRINGRQQWRTWDRKRDAEDYLDNLSPEVRDGSYREIKKATFGEYVATWREIGLNDRTLKPSTLNAYASVIEHHLLPAFKQYPLLAMTSDEIGLFTARLLKNNLKSKTVRNILILLGKILVDAKRAHYLKYNPMLDVDKPKAGKDRIGRALKPDEINSILKECGERLRLIFLTAVLTGMRRGEVLALDWENVDFGNNTIRVRRALFWKHGKYQERPEGEPRFIYVSPKSKESIRDIDLSPALRKELLALSMKGGRKGLVFCSDDCHPLDPDNLSTRDFPAVLRKAEAQRKQDGLPAIGKVRWHDLRHTFGSLKIEQGENVYYVMRQMGHSSIQVTVDCYAHQLKDRKPEAAIKTDAMIFGV